MEFLHLEDHEPLREVLRIALLAADPTLKVMQFEDSDNAVQYIQEHKQEIDLFILDIRVPGEMDGIGVARKIRDLGCDGIIVLTSAYGRPEQDFLDSHQCVWMAKPWHLVDAARKLFPLAKTRGQPK
ncbi:MAG: response regulator [Anaerolineae bacterium]|jgi:CheY-like chemotaxis protein|nr:response regulator [Anaerolineae bacterium]